MKHIRPRKGLGQAFLTHEPTADGLVAALAPTGQETVLEIGPGKGVLTRRLLERAGAVIAVELDPRLAAGLAAELKSDRLSVVQADFLEYDLASHHGLVVMGNLPYNLSSQMLFRLLDARAAWSRAVLTTQREFAARLLAGPGSRAYGALTVLFERLMLRERLFNIRPEAFKPRPDVVSTAFRLTVRPAPWYDVEDEDWFRRVVRAGFAQRRKTVVNSLAAGLGCSREQARAGLVQAGIDPQARAETLDGPAFARLARSLGPAEG
jgi:16S rRNA (adenine1518-N6/adenine1519-N6)-dimethyltransferase